MSKLKDITGEKFGMLTVIERLPTIKAWGQWHTRYLVKCDCGVVREMNARDMTSGNTKSCGCMRYEGRKLGYGESGFNRTIRHYKKNAKRKFKTFEITNEQFRKLSKEDCFYCGAVPSNVCKDVVQFGEYTYNGLDRIDSNLNYTISNVVPCCRRCNVAKNDMTFDEFIEWVGKVSFNLIDKNIFKTA